MDLQAFTWLVVLIGALLLLAPVIFFLLGAITIFIRCHPINQAQYFQNWNRGLAQLPWIVVQVLFLLSWLSDTLPNFALPPPYRVLSLCSAFMGSHVVFALVELNIPDLLRQGGMTVDQIASSVSAVHVNGLQRLLDTAVSMGLLHSSSDVHAGTIYKLSKLSAVLCTDHPNSVQPVARLFQSQSKHWYQLVDGIRTGGIPYEIMSGGNTYFGMMEKDPEAAAIFNRAMAALNNLGSFIALVVDFPWEARFERVIDIGGGLGSFVSALLSKHHKMSGVVMDLPHVIRDAEQHWVNSHSQLMDRVTFLPCDFFGDLGVKGTSSKDAFILRNILHDWSDDQCMEILHNTRNAIGSSGARLLIIEMALVKKAEATMLPRRQSDLHMLVLHGGKERNEEEFGQMLAAAKFKLTRVHCTRSLFFVIEAVAV